MTILWMLFFGCLANSPPRTTQFDLEWWSGPLWIIVCSPNAYASKRQLTPWAILENQHQTSVENTTAFLQVAARDTKSVHQELSMRSGRMTVYHILTGHFRVKLSNWVRRDMGARRGHPIKLWKWRIDKLRSCLSMLVDDHSWLEDTVSRERDAVALHRHHPQTHSPAHLLTDMNIPKKTQPLSIVNMMQLPKNK